MTSFLTNQYKTLAGLLVTLVIATSCTSEKKDQQWSKIKIDPKISSNPVYSKLNKQKEIFSAFEKRDTLIHKTSNVIYFFGEDINSRDNDLHNYNNCRVNFFRSDTLLIKIGIETGFGGQGFTIKYKERNFYTEPYFDTDVIIEGKQEPKYKMVYQDLILNKSDYKIGDSLYGKIQFKSIETDRENKKISHTGWGYFRAKVGKL